MNVARRGPPRPAESGSDWTREGSVQLRYDEADRQWTLYWVDSDDRCHVVELIEPGTVAELLLEVEIDRTNIFWG